MKTEYEQRWREVAQEVLLEMGKWREEHPTATLQEIEEEVDRRMARLRAGLVEGVAMSSAAAEVGKRAGETPLTCPTCGGVLYSRGKQVRKLTTTGEQTVRLERSYGYCPTCQVGFFPGIQVAEATVRQVTEQTGEGQVRWQEEQARQLLRERPESPAAAPVQLMSLDGCYIQMVGGEWKEVRRLSLGVVGEPVEEQGEQVVHTRDLSYFSRLSEAEQFQQDALVEIYERGVEKAEVVCAVSDGADWIPKFVDYHRPAAIRILDAGACHAICGRGGASRS